MAERWLAAHLTAADFAPAAEAARAGDAEMRRRLSWALAADSRNLGLAVLFLADSDTLVSEVGRVAVLEMIDQWNGAAEQPPLARSVIPADWQDSETRRLAIDLRAGGIAAIVDRVERLAPAPATVVLDPGLDPGVRVGAFWPAQRSDGFEGVWPDMIRELARVHRVAFEVHGQRAPLRGAQPWVRICASGGGTTFGPPATTAELCLEWCRGVVRQDDPAWRIACARALAAIGWPAAISWFEQSWSERRDPAAREALLLAAGRGRVAPSFATPAGMTDLLASIDRDLAKREPGALARAQGFALAVAAMGQLGTDGRWSAILTSGWEGLVPASRWMRMIALEGHGRADARVRQLVRIEFAREGQPELRFQALRTMASLTESAGKDIDLEVRAPEELFERGQDWLDELTLHLATAGVPFPDGDWHGRLEGPRELLAVLSWRLEAGGGPDAVELFWRILQSGALDMLSEHLRVWCGMARAGSVDELLAQASAAAPDAAGRARVERVRLRAGLLSEADQRLRLDRLLAETPLDADELLDLGTLCAASGVGWRARAALVERIADMPPVGDLAPAVAEALIGLGRVRLDREADVLASRLRTAARAATHPILDVLYGAGWPPYRLPAALALDPLDRRIGFSGP